jgi:hypothetical protein
MSLGEIMAGEHFRVQLPDVLVVSDADDAAILLWLLPNKQQILSANVFLSIIGSGPVEHDSHQ